MRITDDTPTVFDPTTNRLIDFVAATETPEQAVARLAEYGSHLLVLPCAEAHQRYRQSFLSEPEEITADRFHEMLNILPPCTGTGMVTARASR